jgi:hypothetical protein
VSLRLTVEVVCDARRAPGCHRTSAARGEAVPAVVFEVRKEAERAGWGREEAKGHLIGNDVCPACRVLPGRPA